MIKNPYIIEIVAMHCGLVSRRFVVYSRHIFYTLSFLIHQRLKKKNLKMSVS